MIAERRYPNRVGQTYRLRYNPAHRWFYFPEMRRDEALVFKVFESEKDGRARFTPHTSFEDPTTPSGAPILNGITTLVKMGEMAVKLDRIMGGTFTSKRLQYAPPGSDQIAEIREYYGANIYPSVKPK